MFTRPSVLYLLAVSSAVVRAQQVLRSSPERLRKGYSFAPPPLAFLGVHTRWWTNVAVFCLFLPLDARNRFSTHILPVSHPRREPYDKHM